MPIKEINRFAMLRVRERRIELDISMSELSAMIGKAASFVSHVESEYRGAHYNLDHLNELAKVLKCSPKDFMPQQPL